MTYCPELDRCPKVAIVLDKDLAGDWQYAEVIRAVCARCTAKKQLRSSR